MLVRRLAASVVLALLLVGTDANDEDDDGEEHEIEKLKAEIFSLTPDEAVARFGEVRPRAAAPPRQDKIDHFVVLYMENHPADHIFGCMDLPGFDGIPAGGHQVPHVPGLGA